MTTSQPLPRPGAATARTAHLRSLPLLRQPAVGPAPLIRLWRELAVQTTTYVAHGHTEPPELLERLLSCESELRRRYPEQTARWDDLLVWEANLLHAGDGAADSCITCQRSRHALLTAEVSA